MSNSPSKRPNPHPWFFNYDARPSASIMVFAFPQAGGAASSFRAWGRSIIPEAELCCVEYPGRGSRMSEQLITNMDEMIKLCAEGLVPYINKPFVFVGHSLGTALSYGVARYLIKHYDKHPLLLVELGRGPPHLKDPDPDFSGLNDDELVAELKKIGDASTSRLLDIPDLRSMMLPIIRSDAALASVLLPKDPAIDVPITIFGGNQEERVDEAFLKRWDECTTLKHMFKVKMFNGNHFFHSADQCEKAVLAALNEELTTAVANKDKPRPKPQPIAQPAPAQPAPAPATSAPQAAPATPAPQSTPQVSTPTPATSAPQPVAAKPAETPKPQETAAPASDKKTPHVIARAEAKRDWTSDNPLNRITLKKGDVVDVYVKNPAIISKMGGEEGEWYGKKGESVGFFASWVCNHL